MLFPSIANLRCTPSGKCTLVWEPLSYNDSSPIATLFLRSHEVMLLWAILLYKWFIKVHFFDVKLQIYLFLFRLMRLLLVSTSYLSETLGAVFLLPYVGPGVPAQATVMNSFHQDVDLCLRSDCKCWSHRAHSKCDCTCPNARPTLSKHCDRFRPPLQRSSFNNTV